MPTLRHQWTMGPFASSVVQKEYRTDADALRSLSLPERTVKCNTLVLEHGNTWMRVRHRCTDKTLLVSRQMTLMGRCTRVVMIPGLESAPTSKI